MKKIIIVILAVASSLAAVAAPDNAKAKKILHDYRVKCDLVADKPVVLNMADTLYNMADRLHNNNFKFTARCLKITYFFNRADVRDSVTKYCEMVKNMCQTSDDDMFYYFAWAESIADRLSRRQFNLAMKEINELRILSLGKHNMLGLATCYSQMTDLYTSRGNYYLAAESMKKCVNLMAKYKLDDYNMSVYYTVLAQCLLKEGHADEAYVAIKKAYKTSRMEGHLVQAMAAEAEYWYQKKNVGELKRLLEASTKKTISLRDRAVFAAQYSYDLLTKNYPGAEKALDGLYSLGALQQGDYLQRKAKMYGMMPGGDKKAIKYWIIYTDYKDSLYKADANVEISEFATMMDMAQLKVQNQQMLIDKKTDRVKKTMILLGISFVFIVILTVMIIKYGKLNRHLRVSQINLEKQNGELLMAKQIIIREKEYIQRMHDMEDAYVNNVSYELASPVNGIIGYGQVLQEIKDNPQAVLDCAAEIERTGKNLYRMLSEMNILFSLHLDKSKISLTPLSANDCARVAIAQIEKWNNVNVDIHRDVWEDEFEILSDNTSVIAIIQHLLDNSLKFASDSDINVDVNLSDDRKNVVIRVSDNGPGIPVEKRETVFDGFAKLDKFIPGAGLGLTISRITAERIGGQLYIDDAYTDGCRFVLLLPATKYDEA